MVSPSSTEHKTSNSFKSSIKNLTLLSASVALSTLVGCGSIPPLTDSASPAPTEQAEASSSESAEMGNSSPQAESKVQPEKKVASEQDADKLMASLKAPVVEPGAESDARDSEDSAPVDVTKADANTAAETVQESAEKASEAAAVVEAGVAKEVEKEAEKEAEKAVEEKVEKVAEKTVEVAVEKAAEKHQTAKNTAKPLAISRKDLPATYDIWILKQGETPLTQGLVISTPTWEMGKEGYMSQIWLTIKDDALHVNSSSDIATEVKGLGVSIDGGDLIPFTKVVENKIGVVEGDWLDKLANAQKLDIYLGFFPGKKPRSDRFESDTSLENLDRVVATYKKLK